jgi:hypothetical protein
MLDYLPAIILMTGLRNRKKVENIAGLKPANLLLQHSSASRWCSEACTADAYVTGKNKEVA